MVDTAALPEPPSVSGHGDLLKRVRLAAAGLYAWLVTLAAPALNAERTRLPLAAAGIALCALLLGVMAAPGSPRVGRAAGIYGFGAATIAGWAALGAELDHLEPVRAALGSIAWVFYALAWGTRFRQAPAAREQAELEPHTRLSNLGFILFACAALGALGLLCLAFRVEQRENALFAHALATLGAVALLSGSVRVGLRLTDERSPVAPKVRLRSARASLLFLSLLLLAVLWLLCRQ